MCAEHKKVTIDDKNSFFRIKKGAINCRVFSRKSKLNVNKIVWASKELKKKKIIRNLRQLRNKVEKRQLDYFCCFQNLEITQIKILICNEFLSCAYKSEVLVLHIHEHTHTHTQTHNKYQFHNTYVDCTSQKL